MTNNLVAFLQAVPVLRQFARPSTFTQTGYAVSQTTVRLQATKRLRTFATRGATTTTMQTADDSSTFDNEKMKEMLEGMEVEEVDDLEAYLNDLQNSLDHHESTLEDFANVPLVNTVFLTGRLGRDPVLKTVGAANRQVCTFSMAVEDSEEHSVTLQKDGKNHVSWFDIEAWGSLAVSIARQAKKGLRVGVTGSIGMEQWTGRDGLIREYPVVRATSFEVLQSRTEAMQGQPPSPSTFDKPSPSTNPQPQSYNTDNRSLDDLPF